MSWRWSISKSTTTCTDYPADSCQGLSGTISRLSGHWTKPWGAASDTGEWSGKLIKLTLKSDTLECLDTLVISTNLLACYDVCLMMVIYGFFYSLSFIAFQNNKGNSKYLCVSSYRYMYEISYHCWKEQKQFRAYEWIKE